MQSKLFQTVPNHFGEKPLNRIYGPSSYNGTLPADGPHIHMSNLAQL